MAHYDYRTNKVYTAHPKKDERAKGWFIVDCGCSNGLQWGGVEPRECRNCGGCGVLYYHFNSGALAQYPGRPFVGKRPAKNGNTTTRITLSNSSDLSHYIRRAMK